MFGNVIGLDVGTDSIKVCCARRSWRGIHITRLFHETLPAQGSEEEWQSSVVAKLREILASCGPGAAHIVSALSAGAAILRDLDLPISKIQKLREVVPFEVEPQLSLSLEEVVLDFLIKEGNGHGGSKILAAAVPRTRLERHLDLLARAGLDPACVDLDLLAASYPFAGKRALKASRLQILVDLGAGKTCLAVLNSGRVVSMRSFPVGGLHLTRALAAEKGLPFQEAEEFKKTQLPADFRLWPQAAVSHFEYLRKEMEKTLHVTRAGGNSNLTPSAAIVLCGGGARTKGLKEYLTAYLACPVSTWRIPHPPLNNSPEDECLFAVSSGLAWRGIMGGQPSLNFRRGEFARPEPRSLKKIQLAWSAAAFLLMLAVGGGDLWWRIELESRRLEGLTRQVEQTYRQTFPGTSRIVGPAVEIRQAVDRNLEKLKGAPALDPDSTGAMGLLIELSERIPAQVKWTVSDLSVSEEEISLRGEASSFDGVEEIRRALDKSPLFSAVRVTNVRAGAVKERVEASFLLTLKRRDGAVKGQIRRAT